MLRRVVVVGGGPGGLAVANRLARHRGQGAEIEVSLVERSGEHVFLPGLVAVLFGEAEPAQFRKPLRELTVPGVRVVTGEASELRVAESTVAGSFGELGYDELVVATGVEVGWPDGPPACGELAPWTLGGALAGRDALARMGPRSRVVVGPAQASYRCPPAVFDLAVRLRQRTGAHVEVFHPWGRPLAPFGDAPARAFEAMLGAAGVSFRGGFQLAEITEDRLVAASGDTTDYDFGFIVPPHRAPPLVAGSALAGPDGWPPLTFPSLCHPQYPNVTIIGDLGAPGLRVGMAGTLAVFEGGFAADRIATGPTGVMTDKRPRMSALCFIDPGETGSLLLCDFTGPAAGTGPPDCTMLPFMPWLRRAKSLFASEWFSTTVGGTLS